MRLRRQVHALEEAGLIQSGSRVDRSLATAMTEDAGGRRSGGGALDSSWLNARAKNTIGRGLKEEALRDGKEFLKNGIQTGGEVQAENRDEHEDEDEDEDMFEDD